MILRTCSFESCDSLVEGNTDYCATHNAMNTEQLKTKEEILDKYASEIGNYKDFRGILVAYKLCMDDPNRIDWVVDKAMQDFASQESKIAVSEFKEKLKDKINDSALTHQEKLYFKHLIDS